MYSIARTDFGYRLVFDGFIKPEEMEAWRKESETALQGQAGSFGVYVDMRGLKPLSDQAQATMVKGQQAYRAKGMQRSVVVVANAVTAIQFRRLARESGIAQWERYISPETPEWERVALDWVVNGKDMDAA